MGRFTGESHNEHQRILNPRTGGTYEEKGLPSVGGQGGSVTRWSAQAKSKQFEDFAEDSYSQNAIVRVVNEIAQASTISLEKRREAFEAHPALSLLERPNPLSID